MYGGNSIKCKITGVVSLMLIVLVKRKLCYWKNNVIEVSNRKNIYEPGRRVSLNNVHLFYDLSK